MSIEHSPARAGGSHAVSRPPEDFFMTQKTVAAMLGLSERSLERLRCEGRGPHYYKLGRRVLYKKVDVLTWVECRRRSSTSSASSTAGAS